MCHRVSSIFYYSYNFLKINKKERKGGKKKVNNKIAKGRKTTILKHRRNSSIIWSDTEITVHN